MTVVNYSVQDIFGPDDRVFVGAEWYREILRDDRLRQALLRQFVFSFAVLLIEIPLGIAVALAMPRKGRWASLTLVVLALPLLIPWNVVGTIWQIFGRADIGLGGVSGDRPRDRLQLRREPLRRLGDGAGHGCVALDVAGGAALFLRAQGHSRRLLPGGADRRRLVVGGLPLCPAAEAQERAPHRGAAAVHGQLHDLLGALRAHRWRPRQLDDLSQPDPRPARGRPVRPRARGRILA